MDGGETVTLREIAVRIDAHLKRFERDPKINTRTSTRGGLRYSRFYRAGAASSGRFVYVSYVAYQGQNHLDKTDAICYLAWLNRGNVGTHREALRGKG